MGEKVTGYVLIAVGLGIVFFAAFSVYSVFTARAAPVALFNFPGVSIPLSALVGGDLPVSAGALPDVEIFPAEVLNSTTNVIAHLFLMGFMASVGQKVASIGVSLARPVVVKVDSKKMPAQAA